MTVDTSSLLDMLIQHERALARLYLRFATIFGERQQFWQALAAEEHKHAQRLETLRNEPGLRRWLDGAGKITSQAVRSSIDYVEGQAARAAAGELGLLQALSVARDLEDALIDRQFALPVPSDCGALGAVVSELLMDTEEHRRTLAEALEAERSKQGRAG